MLRICLTLYCSGRGYESLRFVAPRGTVTSVHHNFRSDTAIGHIVPTRSTRILLAAVAILFTLVT